jgi:hypothetical protein
MRAVGGEKNIFSDHPGARRQPGRLACDTTRPVGFPDPPRDGGGIFSGAAILNSFAKHVSFCIFRRFFPAILFFNRRRFCALPRYSRKMTKQ